MKYKDKETGEILEVIESTSNSVRFLHKARTTKGIDSYQWHNTEEKRFKDRFKKQQTL